MPRFSFLLRLPVLLFLVHLYTLWRLASGFQDSGMRWSVAFILGVSYAVMMAGFLARDKVGDRLSDAVSWAGFLALGLFSWIFVLTVLRDVALLARVIFLLCPYFRGFIGEIKLEEFSAWAVMIGSVVASIWGFFGARRRPAIVDVDIFISGLPSEFDGFRIVQITDLHVGPTIKKRFVQQVVDINNCLDPDVTVLTGDLVDGSVERLTGHTQSLSQLSAKHGVVAVTGNHEYYVGVHPWVAEFKRLGITVLLNEHQLITRGKAVLILAGVTDFGAEKFELTHASDPVAALHHAPRDVTTVKILLAHQPRSIFAAAPLGFDLQLSGHTHGGQYWPWGYFVPLQQPFVAGLHRYENTQLYISRGTGYWGPPLRLGARSEISHIRLRRSEPAHETAV